ncbi:MAG TPA: cytochrome c [Pseudomonadota bacterium]|nr:cytochrome c [Pseudomonadota bacterium]
MKAHRNAQAAWLCALLLFGCQRTTGLPPIEPPPVVSEAAKAQGAKLFAEHCVRCHGVSGWGDGPEALANKKVRVQDLGDPVWQSNVSNGRLVAAIVRGGPGVRKSAQMPAFPLLAKNREEIDGLVAHIRSLARTTP